MLLGGSPLFFGKKYPQACVDMENLDKDQDGFLRPFTNVESLPVIKSWQQMARLQVKRSNGVKKAGKQSKINSVLLAHNTKSTRFYESLNREHPYAKDTIVTKPGITIAFALFVSSIFDF
jgi:hypothetical protein